MTYYRILRKEDISGQYIVPDERQERVIGSYVERYRAELGQEPVGVHYLYELAEFVFLPPTEAIVEGE